jgi:hypothetical protein
MTDSRDNVTATVMTENPIGEPIAKTTLRQIGVLKKLDGARAILKAHGGRHEGKGKWVFPDGSAIQVTRMERNTKFKITS